MAVKVGIDGDLYLCEDGIGGTPTWTEVEAARDVSCSLKKGEADASTRGKGKWKLTVATMKEAEITFELLYDDEDEVAETILDAWLDDTPIGLAVAKDDITKAGTKVFMADCVILTWDEKEPMDGAVLVSVTAKPTYTENRPKFITVGQ